MGLLGALGAGVAAAAEYGADGMMSKMKAEIEQQKQEALLMMKEQMDIRGEERKEARDKPLRDLQIGNEKLKQEGLINQRITEGVQSGTLKEGQMADGSFVSVGDDGVARRLNKDGTPMTAARGKDGAIAGTDAKTFGMDAKEKLSLKAVEAQINASNSSASNAALERQLNEMKVADAIKVRTLQNEFLAAKPAERGAILEKIQVLTGKDGDKFIPLMGKDEMGNPVVVGKMNGKTGEMWDAKGNPIGGAAKGGGDIDKLREIFGKKEPAKESNNESAKPPSKEPDKGVQASDMRPAIAKAGDAVASVASAPISKAKEWVTAEQKRRQEKREMEEKLSRIAN